ncbi:hypothetical protein [Rhizobium mongolense]|uniref:Uncharacterized protein n=2 Tax=Rhizobium mongolense TaxID=57676 RepID=A0ABR6IQD5_9HYPH|nr:hypothetical protein [Rhizobium mongolense]MBB4230115.1 hypothetical protein [Rhizobium mongolense]TVZ72755.1 hypothetical protein BCL32_0941 [Rhizobium mongolense USDA 1844]
MTSLVPDAFYWATSDKHTNGQTTIVQVSTVFGGDPGYWTLAIVGSDQHHMIDEFELIARVEPPEEHLLRQAAASGTRPGSSIA